MQQPYQKASEATARQSEVPNQLAKTAFNVGTSALGYGAAGRVIPFLSKFIPEDLFMKGLAKIDPRLGKFVNQAVKQGYNVDEVKGFLGEKAQKEEQNKVQDERNIIEQESPELHQFLSQEIAKGRPPLHAGGIAQQDKRFSEVIKKLSKKHKTDWSKIIEAIYGQEAKALPQQQQQSALAQEAMNPQGSQPQRLPSAEQQAQTQQQPHPNSAQGKFAARDQQLQQQQGQPGQGQQALMAVLQKINQRLGS